MGTDFTTFAVPVPFGCMVCPFTFARGLLDYWKQTVPEQTVPGFRLYIGLAICLPLMRCRNVARFLLVFFFADQITQLPLVSHSRFLQNIGDVIFCCRDGDDQICCNFGCFMF